MTVLDDFLSNPPLFMRRNHVAFKGEMPAGPGVHAFLLLPLASGARTRSGVFLGKSTGKADAGAWEIRFRDARMLDPQRRAAGMEFTAHWGGFVAGGKVEYALDGGGPDIMLTPELTGCAIAFSAGAEGHARFSHYNMKDGTRTLGAAGMLDAARDDYAGDGAFGLLTKEDYHGMSGADMRDARQVHPLERLARRVLPANRRTRPTANVVGWRQGGRWHFWTQYTDMKGTVAQILDVRQLAPGARMG